MLLHEIKNLRLKVSEVKIEVENPGILEIPRDKKFWEMPLEHYIQLINKKGYESIIKALNNLQVWNKNGDTDQSKQAKEIMDKLKAKFNKK